MLIAGTTTTHLLRTLWDPLAWIPWIVLLAGAFGVRDARCWNPRRRVAVSITIAIAVAVVLLFPMFSFRNQSEALSPVLVCVGDSLTAGVDFRSDAETYVAVLRGRLDIPVLNAGRANDKAADVLARLDEDVLARHPTLTLIFIGGNDALDGTPRDQFAASLEMIVRKVSQNGSRIILVEVPAGILIDPYAGLYRRVAHDYGALLVPESWLRVLFMKELLFRGFLERPMTIDGIHLSPEGAAIVANWLEPYVRQMLASNE